MKLSKLLAGLAVAASLVSGVASATIQDLTTWNTFTGVNGSVSVSPSSASMSGTAGIYQSFNLAAGSPFSFNWLFQAGDYLPFNDFASVFVDGNLNFVLSNVAAVGDYGSSGPQFYSTVLTNPVNGNITFSVSNVNDNSLNSTLTVSNVNVPEPDMLLLMATALGLVAFASRRKSKRAA